MASNVLLLHTMEQSKRRLYSKKGCKECKRRKIKCDEGEPFCWQCHRLKKVCEYPKAGEKVKRASIRKIEWERTSEQQQKQKQQQLQPLLEELQQQQQQQAQAQPQSQPQIQHFQTPPSNGTVNGGTRKRSTSSILNLLNYTPSQTQTVNSLHEYQNTQHQVFHSDHTTPQSHSPIRQSLPNIYPPGLPHEPQIHHRLNQPLLQSATPIPLPTSAIQTTVTTAAVLPPLHQQTDVVVIPTQFPVQPPVPAPSVTSASSLSTPLDGLEFNGFSRDDLDLLASDLNSIVNNIMGESNYEIREDNKADFEIPKNQSPVLLNTYNLTTENLHFMDMVQPIPQTSSAHLSYNTTLSPSASTPYNHFTRQAKEGTTNPNLKPANTTATIHTNVPNMATIPKSVPLDFIKITKPHEKLYLEEFYNEFSGVILPFNAYDETTSTYMNPARDILLTCASRETYLLAAILAQGAKTSFKMSGIQEDEKAYCFYLSKCLQLLGPALDNNKSNEGGNNLTSNIEAVLLTVLLLTSANASNTKQNWRAHLRGAKDILLKYTTNSNKNKKLKSIRTSPILVFCKYWYISIEILAGLSSEYGGTLKGDQLDLLITPGTDFEIQVMKAFKLIKDDGFNIVYGYHTLCVVHLRDLIKILNKIRENSDKKDNYVNTNEYLRLICEFYKQSLHTYIDNSGIVEESKLSTIPPGGSLIETFSNASKRLLVSWIDILHQSFIIAAQITILTRCFRIPTTSPEIQELVSKFVTMLTFLNFPDPPSIKYSALMIQWPVLVIGSHCLKEEDRYLVMKLFRLSAQIGSGSAGISLRRLHKRWTRGAGGNGENGEDEDDDSEVDLMTY